MKQLLQYHRKSNLVGLVPLLLLTLVCACGHLEPGGVYNGDKFLYEMEGAISDAHGILQDFVNWEYNHREYLAQWPEIRSLADKIVSEGPQWFVAARAARNAYVGDPTAENKGAFQTAVEVIRAVITSSQGFITNHATPTSTRTTNAPPGQPSLTPR